YRAEEFSHIFDSGTSQKLAIVALGNGGDLTSLRNLAQAGKGEFHVVTDLQYSPKVLVKILASWNLLQ
ncbi:MAG: hypothetical protein KDD62_07320, partial [Bdellovibrionales bacterium]|nr:hypothetical protein [Bdellovibrionales bacterium]